MSPPEKAKALTLVAEWMLKQSTRASIIWFPPVITSTNPDSSRPCFSLKDAQAIFTHFSESGILDQVDAIAKIGTEDRRVSGYKFNNESETHLSQLARKSSLWHHFIKPWLSEIFGSRRPQVYALLALLLSPLYAAWCESLFDSDVQKIIILHPDKNTSSAPALAVPQDQPKTPSTSKEPSRPKDADVKPLPDAPHPSSDSEGSRPNNA